MSDDPIVVAIDGPAGVGKSTVARAVASHLRLSYVDTGAMYRAVGLEALRRGVDVTDADAVERLAGDVEIDLAPGEDGTAIVRLRGHAVGEEIREPAVGDVASQTARHPAVRRRLVEIQRDFGRYHGVVMEGRDIGTVVFPATPYKFFLDADPVVRTRRRVEQLEAAGRSEAAAAAVDELRRRDVRDRERTTAPLRADESYLVVDSTHLTADEVVARLVAAVTEPG